ARIEEYGARAAVLTPRRQEHRGAGRAVLPSSAPFRRRRCRTLRPGGRRRGLGQGVQEGPGGGAGLQRGVGGVVDGGQGGGAGQEDVQLVGEGAGVGRRGVGGQGVQVVADGVHVVAHGPVDRIGVLAQF